MRLPTPGGEFHHSDELYPKEHQSVSERAFHNILVLGALFFFVLLAATVSLAGDLHSLAKKVQPKGNRLLNLGVGLAVAETVFTLKGLAWVGRVAEIGAVLAFVIGSWRRVKPFAS